MRRKETRISEIVYRARPFIHSFAAHGWSVDLFMSNTCISQLVCTYIYMRVQLRLLIARDTNKRTREQAQRASQSEFMCQTFISSCSHVFLSSCLHIFIFFIFISSFNHVSSVLLDVDGDTSIVHIATATATAAPSISIPVMNDRMMSTITPHVASTPASTPPTPLVVPNDHSQVHQLWLLRMRRTR